MEALLATREWFANGCATGRRANGGQNGASSGGFKWFPPHGTGGHLEKPNAILGYGVRSHRAITTIAAVSAIAAIAANSSAAAAGPSSARLTFNSISSGTRYEKESSNEQRQRFHCFTHVVTCTNGRPDGPAFVVPDIEYD